MLQLAWPWLAACVGLPLLVAPWVPRAADRRVALRIPFFAATRTWPAGARPARITFRTLIAAAAWLALVLAACRPQWADETVRLAVSGRSMLLALDVSQSMLRRDLGGATDGSSAPTRLQIVQRSARAFIERRSGDRLGLILFGSRAYVQCPLTFDRSTVTRMVDDALIGVAGELTSLGDAIALAIKRLRALPSSERVVIVLTDGANTAGVMEPLEAARLARHHGIRVYTIGVGRQGPGVGPDHALLGRIADMTGARHFSATDAPALKQVYDELDALEPRAHGEQRFTPVRDLYHWPLGAALVLLMGIAVLDIGRSLRAGAQRALSDPTPEPIRPTPRRAGHAHG